MSNIVEAILLPTGSNVAPEPVLIDDYKSIQRIVGGTFDCVRTDMGRDDVALVGYVHDEGLLLNMDYNYLATALFKREIRGDVVVVWGLSPNGHYDGDNHDMPKHINDFLRTDLLIHTATAYNMATTMSLVTDEIVKAGYPLGSELLTSIDALEELACSPNHAKARLHSMVVRTALMWGMHNLDSEYMREFCELMVDTVFADEEDK